MGHHARFVQRGLPVGQHQVAIPQVAVHRLALAGLGCSRTRTRQQLLCDRVPLLQAATSLLMHPLYDSLPWVQHMRFQLL